MARIFLSHSSGNNAEAIALRDWLISHGWDDLFLDLDPERGLKAGERWQAALKRAAERCELVIFLVSPEWAASKWCLAEFLLAKNLNKRIFGVVVEPTPLGDMPVEMTAEWRLVDLTAGNRDYKVTVTPPPGDKTETVGFAEDGLERLRIGLMQAGLDARYFAWPPEDDSERAPYRGLEPLEAKDAGIFFGRDGPTIVGLDLLRGLREAAPPRLLVILGASGAGKSSFLRAGLLPRLARESQHFLPLPGHCQSNRAENSHQPFRRRERAMAKFRDMQTLQKFAAAHASIHNHFNHDRHLNRRDIFKQNRSTALGEWRQLAA
jgi:hypothetical protein